MSNAIDWSTSEPPNRYVLAYGTQHCLIEQDYDHTIYGECEYVASRTLIKCKAVRKKADLKANGGICEMHGRFHESIKNRFLCEERRLMQDTGQGKTKYNPVLNQDGLVCDEFPWLMPSHRWESPLPRSIYDDAPDDDPAAPLRHAGIYTEKDIVKMRKALAEKKLELLKLHAEMLVERSRRRANDLFSKNGKPVALGENSAVVAAACSSLDDYGYLSKRIMASQKYKTGEWTRTEPPLCSFGKFSKNNLSSDETAIVKSVMDAILDCMAEEKSDFASYMKVKEEREPSMVMPNNEEVKQCTELAIPLSNYCISHQMLDDRQCIYFPCSLCHTMCMDIHSPPLCGKHLNDFLKAKRAPLKDTRLPVSPLISFPSGAPIVSPSSKFKSANDPSKPLFGLPSSTISSPFLAGSSTDKRTPKRVATESYPKEETESNIKRFRTEAPILGESVAQGQSSAVSEAIKRAELRRSREDEVCSCARIRPFDRSHFPPKPSVPRRVSSVARPVMPIRRPNLIEGATMQLQSSHIARTSSPASRLSAGSEVVTQRQFPMPAPSRRPQPPHRFLQKDTRQPHQIFISSKPQLSNISPSTGVAVLDEAGNELLIEDRRTPPHSKNQSGTLLFSESGMGRTAASQPRAFISSYRRPYASIRQHSGIQHIREGVSYVEPSRSHPLPPPPDPPIIPLTRVSEPTITTITGVSNAVEKEMVGGTLFEVKTVALPQDAEVPHGRDTQPIAGPSSDQEDRILAPPPPPPILRSRFPSILRKTENSATSSSLANLPQPPPPPNLSQRPLPSTVLSGSSQTPLPKLHPAPLPRPPPASRPLPPHRLLNTAIKGLPPHRLIKSLPLPVVPAPRAPKPASSMESSGAPEHCKSAEDETKYATSSEHPTLPADAASSQEKTIADKANELSSEDLDPLRILAAVSEAARDSAASGNAAISAASVAVSAQRSEPSQSANITNNGDDDDDFEEEL